MVISIALVLWVGVTSAVNTRRVQQRMKCSAQMKRIGAAVMEYSGQIPGDESALDWLVASGLVVQEDARCPSAGGNANYVLAPDFSKSEGAVEGYLVTEPGTNHRDGANTFFRNGDCKFIRKAQFRELGIPDS